MGAAGDGETAARLVAELAPDVVVLDYRMPPGPSGLEIAERIRRDHPDVRVVIYSNYQSVELVARAAALGVPFLPKGSLRSLRRAVGP